MQQIVGPCVSVYTILLFPDTVGFFHLSCPAVPLSVHYFSSSLVDDMVVPGDMVRDCRSVHLSERSFSFCSCVDFAARYFCVLSMFFQSFTLDSCLFLQCKHSGILNTHSFVLRVYQNLRVLKDFVAVLMLYVLITALDQMLQALNFNVSFYKCTVGLKA